MKKIKEVDNFWLDMSAICGQDLNFLIRVPFYLRTIYHDFSATNISGLRKLVEENFPSNILLTHIKLSLREVECGERTAYR